MALAGQAVGMRSGSTSLCVADSVDTRLEAEQDQQDSGEQISNVNVRGPHGGLPMTSEQQNDTLAVLVRRLVERTSITEEQARELVLLIGFEWPSLLREALAIKPKDSA